MSKKVLLAIDLRNKSSQAKMYGILKYLSGQLGWETQLVQTSEECSAGRLRRALREGVDGFILDLLDAKAIEDVVVPTKTPKVLFDADLREGAGGNTIMVHNSQADIARKAAAHFLARRSAFRSFAFAPLPESNPWTPQRGIAFAKHLASFGIDCAQLDGVALRDLAEQLKALEKPAAVLAGNDVRALDVLAAAKRAKLNVPGDVSVLGIDDDPVLCETSRPKLSSVRIGFEQEGFLAAKALDGLIAHRTGRIETIDVDAECIVVRDSTVPAGNAIALVQRADDYIAKHALEGIGVEHVVRHLHVSRRLLYLRFAEIRRESVHAAIERARLEEVKRRLRDTTLSIDEVARACGFDNPNHLRNLFKRRIGLSMRAWRARPNG